MSTATPGVRTRDPWPGVQAERIRDLNDAPVRGGRYVLYWMQQAQRTEFNHALEVAIHRANELGLPLLVAFGLTDGYPEANLRHYHFLLQGLQDVEARLAERGIPFVLRRGRPDDVALGLAGDAAVLVTDRGYLRPQREWRENVARDAPCRVVQVESDVTVPVELVSDKRETAARTIRPKITRHLPRFLVDLPKAELEQRDLALDVAGEDLGDLDALLAALDVDRSVPPVLLFRGGTTAGEEVLAGFLRDHFTDYAEHRNQPQTDEVSHMSKYLHFGQLSPVYVALQVRAAAAPPEEKETYLEELIVRRELPMNYVFYERSYDRYESVPEWARQTLAEHASDERQYVYTREQLADAETHDPYWNAAMREMRFAGYMHNRMRMYWGKKILEWSATPREGYETTLYLNDRFFLDGRDANSYANVSWIYGLHDRGWTERAVFGKIRYMNAAGLESKADPRAYVRKVDAIVAEVESGARLGPGESEPPVS